MAAISSIVMGAAAAVGVGTSLYGASKSNDAANQQAQIAQQQAQQSAIQTAISKQQTALGAAFQTQQAQTSADFAQQETGINVESAQASVAAAQQSYAINQNIIGASQAIEATRQTAMELDARRSKLELLRQGQRQAALGLANANAQGATFGSGLQGGRAQIQSQTAFNVQGVNQNLDLGRNIFAQNASISQAQLQQSGLELMLAQQNASFQTRASQLRSQYAQITANQQTDYTQQNAALTTQYATVGGNINNLQGQMVGAQAQGAFGQSLMSTGANIFAAGVSLAPTAANIFSPKKA